MELKTDCFIYGAAAVMLTVLALFFQSAYASEITGDTISTPDANISAGTTPDSPLYFFDVFFDNVNLALTADPAEKSKKALNIARERLMEVKKMAEAGNMDAAKVAQKEHANTLEAAKESLAKIDITNSTQEIQKEIDIQKNIMDHEKEVKTVDTELKFKAKTEKDLSQIQKDALNSISSGLENKTDELKTEMEDKRNETRTKIRQKTNRSDDDIAKEIRDMEIKSGLSEKDATSGSSDSKSKKVEIEVDIQNDTSQVKITDDQTKKRFVLDTADKERIISRIMTETGLPRDEILSNLVFKDEANKTSEDAGTKVTESISKAADRKENQTDGKGNETDIKSVDRERDRQDNRTEIRNESKS